MAILQYIRGDKRIDGSDRYHLEYQKSDGSYQRIETREVLQTFNHRGVIVDGKVKEQSFRLDRFNGLSNRVNLVPIRVLTEEGVKGCIRVEGQINIIYKDGTSIYKNFDAVYYIDNIGAGENVSVYMPAEQNQITQNGDSWYLGVTIDGRIHFMKIFAAGAEDIAYVGFYSRYNELDVYGAALSNDYLHTDYIYINCLTDDYATAVSEQGAEYVCVGLFDLEDTLGYDKMAFYNKNLKYLGRATPGDIESATGYKYEAYVTKDQIIGIARDVCGCDDPNDEENYPRFVVFCSKDPGTSDKDIVSVGNPYFPLFDMPAVEQAFVTENTTTLMLSAIADTRFAGYKPSERSTPPLKYDKPQV